MKRVSLFLALIAGVIFTSCENGNWEFSDFDYSTVYFAYQTPVRTITLGNDYVNDNSLDNEHKCQIMATVGGFREIKKDIEIGFTVDNTLCANLDNVKAMPSNYYTLSDNSKMIIAKGSKMIGGVVVQLTDAFFADPLSLTANYVIPLRMTSVTNADRILAGEAVEGVTNPNRVNKDDWATLPKDYILYAVKYINNWDAIYLRRGKDVITENGVTRTVVRRGQYVPEDDELVRLYSASLKEIEFPMSYQSSGSVDLGLKLKMTFSGNDCSFSAFKTDYTVADTIRVYDVVVTGTGKYVKDGEKFSWGQKDRDALYLDYNVAYKVNVITQGVNQNVTYSTKDTLVLRDRNIKVETFTPELK